MQWFAPTHRYCTKTLLHEHAFTTKTLLHKHVFYTKKRSRQDNAFTMKTLLHEHARSNDKPYKTAAGGHTASGGQTVAFLSTLCQD